jgi:hypothetical protein
MVSLSSSRCVEWLNPSHGSCLKVRAALRAPEGARCVLGYPTLSFRKLRRACARPVGLGAGRHWLPGDASLCRKIRHERASHVRLSFQGSSAHGACADQLSTGAGCSTQPFPTLWRTRDPGLPGFAPNFGTCALLERCFPARASARRSGEANLIRLGSTCQRLFSSLFRCLFRGPSLEGPSLSRGSECSRCSCLNPPPLQKESKSGRSFDRRALRGELVASRWAAFKLPGAVLPREIDFRRDRGSYVRGNVALDAGCARLDRELFLRFRRTLDRSQGASARAPESW